jgi:hypothetical protein
MIDKKVERYAHLLVKNNSSIYVEEPEIIEAIKGYPCFEISGNCSQEELEGKYNPDYVLPSWYDYLEKNQKNSKVFLIINIINTSIENQKRFIGIIKDRSYQTLLIPDNCKIIVVGNEKTIIDKELRGLLVVIKND